MILRPFLNVPVSANPDSPALQGGYCRDRKLTEARRTRRTQAKRNAELQTLDEPKGDAYDPPGR